MFKLLNKFAWVLSITLGYAMSLSLFLIMFGKIRDESITISMLFGVLFGFIIKKIMFSDNYIRGRLQFFAKQIGENYVSEKSEESEVEETEKVGNVQSTSFSENGKGTINENSKIKEAIIDSNYVDNKYEEKHTQEYFDNKIKEIEQGNVKNTAVVNECITPVKEEEYVYKPSAFEEGLNSLGTYIKEFFSTNLLAKLGGILVFLAVVYFLKGAVADIWDIIGPNGRIFIGILIGFITYGFGIKVYNKSKKEGIILMGTGILINFAVILGGRYLVGGEGYLKEGTTFLFLILNVLFAIVTSLVYKSRTLLLFSFVFAYFNPFIIGADSNGQPYTLIIYSMVISLGALFLARKQNDLALLIISFIAGNLLFLVAPFSDSIGWISKIICTVVLSLSTITLSNSVSKKEIENNGLLYTFLGTYLFVILHLLNSSGALSETFSFIVYNIILLSLFAFTIRLITSVKTGAAGISILLFIPLIIIIGILFSGNLLFLPFVLLGTIFAYMIGFIFLLPSLSSIFIYFFYAILSIFIFIFGIALDFKGLEYSVSNPIEFITVLITAFIFMYSSYYYSIKEKLSNLYSIGTIGTVLIIFPLIVNTYFVVNGKIPKFIDALTSIPNPTNVDILVLFKLSIVAIIVFAISNWLMPFINKNLLKKENFGHLLIGTLVGALFIAFEIYNFGEIHFPGVTEGFAFLGLAIAYFLQAFFLLNKLGIENVKKDNDLKNVFYSFAGISISLFSIAVAFVFSAYPEIISTTWLFEATILYYFYSKTGSGKLFTFATILFAIGLTKFGVLIDVVKEGDFMFLISFTIILISFLLNLKFLNKDKEENNGLSVIHNLGHIVGMIIMGVLLLIIIPSTGHGWSMLGISTFTLLLGVFYAKFNFHILKVVFLFVIAGFGFFHLSEINSIFSTLQSDDLLYLKTFQYIVTGIVISNYFIWNKFNKIKEYNIALTVIVGIYAFLISNVYIYDIFKNLLGNLSLTLYWGLIASVLLTYGIQKDIIKKRTIGLYFLILTSIKIFFFDVWQLGNTNEIVFAFMVLGIIFIIISTMYTKKYGDNLLGELSFSNLSDNKNYTKEDYTKKSKSTNNEVELEKNDIVQEKELKVNESIKDIDVSEYKSVKFKINNGETIQIRTQNLLRIAKLIIDSNNKTVFKQGELTSTYNFITNNYKTDLTKNNYVKILKIVKEFIEKGGEVELIKK